MFHFFPSLESNLRVVTHSSSPTTMVIDVETVVIEIFNKDNIFKLELPAPRQVLYTKTVGILHKRSNSSTIAKSHKKRHLITATEPIAVVVKKETVNFYRSRRIIASVTCGGSHSGSVVVSNDDCVLRLS